jgi:hypothetical protein
MLKLQRLILLTVLGLGLAYARGTAALPGDPAAAPSCSASAPAPAPADAFTAEGTEIAQQKAAVCVWSCQYNPSFGTWKYWFAPALSACPVTKCQPRGGSSPSGTVCNQGDPDIPGDCAP